METTHIEKITWKLYIEWYMDAHEWVSLSDLTKAEYLWEKNN